MTNKLLQCNSKTHLNGITSGKILRSITYFYYQIQLIDTFSVENYWYLYPSSYHLYKYCCSSDVHYRRQRRNTILQ